MKHISYRGKVVDMEEIRRKNEKTVAAGNMGVNANGDKLGRGGEIIETVQRKARKHYKTTSIETGKMSIKGDKEIDKSFKKETTQQRVRKSSPKKSTKIVETENEAGDITVEEVEVNNEN